MNVTLGQGKLIDYGEFRSVRTQHYNLHLGDKHPTNVDDLITEYWIYQDSDSCWLETHSVHHSSLGTVIEQEYVIHEGSDRLRTQDAQTGRTDAAVLHGRYCGNYLTP